MRGGQIKNDFAAVAVSFIKISVLTKDELHGDDGQLRLDLPFKLCEKPPEIVGVQNVGVVRDKLVKFRHDASLLLDLTSDRLLAKVAPELQA